MVTWERIVKANAAIKTMDVKGKDYAEVNQRVKAFRMVYPTGLIDTEIVSNTDGVCIFRATVGYYDEEVGSFVKLATGTAFEVQNASYINKTSYVENCETSAVGRALGMAGFGIDTSICSAEELQNALAQQDAAQTNKPVNEKPEPVADKPKPSKVTDTSEDARYRILALRKVALEKLDRACIKYWKTDFRHTPVEKIREMLPEEYLNKMEDLKNE